MRFLIAVLAVLVPASTALAQAAADLVLVNARVYTVDARRPWADAVAIAGDRIIAVGTTAEIQKRVGPNTRTLDLRGAFVSPGFNDAHVHVDATGALLVGVNLLDVHEATRFAERIKGAVARLPKGSWITRGDWGAYEQWAAGSAGQPAGAVAKPAEAGATAAAKAAGPFMPDRSYIDPIAPDHPVFVNRFDRSAYFANAKALEAAGITEGTVPPPGGEIVKDARGRLTGVLRGAAADLVRKVIPPIPFEQRLVQVKAVLQEAREGGITTIQDLTSPAQLLAYQELRRRGELTARINLRPQLWDVPHIAALGMTRGFGDDWLKLVGYKAWVDGIMGSSGAMFFDAYNHDPGNKGYPRHIMMPEGAEGAAMMMKPSQRYTDFGVGNMEKLIDQAVATGIPPHVHAIGDKGTRIILDIYERILAKYKRIDSDHRWRVIHAQVVHPDDFKRFGQLKLVAEVNPYHVSDDMRWMEERIGAERSRGAYAFRSLKNAGAVLIFGSDSPGTNAARYHLNPIYGLHAAVTRQTLAGEPPGGWFPDQRLTIDEAIEAYTKGPAWASFEEGLKGTLEPGKLADIAVFDTNLVEAGKSNPAALLKAKVLFTIVGGQVVYEGSVSATEAVR